MSCDIVVRVTQLSKCHHIYSHPADRLRQWLFGAWRQYYRQFWAVRDLTFEIARGEVIGILGKNGSGKSTLLQMLCGCVTPTSGEITTQGRISALLELGSGFNPEFSGLENVYLNACILGLSRREVEKRLGDILAFADIGDFIQQSVKSYSSGMAVRLAFAVAAAIEPEILIVDEALAVGDVQFQHKCFRHFNKLVERGTTIILVTQSPEQVVNHCTRALLLDRGELVAQGHPRVVANHYLDLMVSGKSTVVTPASIDNQPTLATNATHTQRITELLNIPFEQQLGYNLAEFRCGNRLATISSFHLATVGSETHRTHFVSGDKLLVTLLVDFLQAYQRPIIELTIKTPSGITVYGNNSQTRRQTTARLAGSSIIATFELALWITSGDYLLSFGVAADEDDRIPLDRRTDSVHVVISNPNNSLGLAELQLHYEEFEIGSQLTRSNSVQR